MLWGYAGTVSESPEFRRIEALPRRLDPPLGVERLTLALRRPGGTQELRPIQAQALGEIHLLRGLLGLVRVGGGKTLISFLAPEMVDAKRPLLLVPAKLREKTIFDFAELREHWGPSVEPKLQSYEKLGRANWADFLDRYQPDLIIADEAHRLKNVRAAVTRRVGRYMTANPGTIFVALSGTLTRRSIMDFAHIAEWCLGDGSPVPIQYADLIEWSGALDEAPESRYRPGPLERFGEGPRLEEVREGVQRRIVETPGVVATSESPIDASLVISDWWEDYVPGRAVGTALADLEEKWETPDGIPLTSAADVWRNAREISLGFYYRWNPTPPAEWLEARRKWAALVRSILLRSRTLDSEAQVAARHCDRSEYRNWMAVRSMYTPSIETVWIDETIVERAAKWAREEGGIVWTDLVAVGKKLDQLGAPYYGELGKDKNQNIIERATAGISASIAANTEGRNLQHYSKNLVLTPPTTGMAWEQLLGRTHRDGQKADEVSVEVFFGCQENVQAFYQAKSDAKYQQQITGSPQKLLEATILFEKVRPRRKT